MIKSSKSKYLRAKVAKVAKAPSHLEKPHENQVPFKVAKDRKSSKRLILFNVWWETPNIRAQKRPREYRSPAVLEGVVWLKTLYFQQK